MKSFLFTFLCLFPLFVFAQNVILNENGQISQLMSKYTGQYKYQKKIKGWRVQFYSTADRRKMEEIKLQLENIYPNEKVVWGFLDPYFHIKIGSFRTKYEAQALFIEIRKLYPGSFLTVDDIDPKDIYLFE